jgi:hypothetical protein
MAASDCVRLLGSAEASLRAFTPGSSLKPFGMISRQQQACRDGQDSRPRLKPVRT